MVFAPLFSLQYKIEVYEVIFIKSHYNKYKEYMQEADNPLYKIHLLSSCTNVSNKTVENTKCLVYYLDIVIRTSYPQNCKRF